MLDSAPVKIDFSKGAFTEVALGNAVSAAVMPLVLDFGEEVQPIGTAFAITPWGICLTARHCLAHAWPDAVDGIHVPNAGPFHVPKRRSLRASDGVLSVLYDPGIPNPTRVADCLGGLIPVHKVHFMDSIDIAAFSLQLPRLPTGELVPLPSLPLDLELPNAEDELLAFGYPKMDWTTDEDARFVDHSLCAARGTLEQIYLPKRPVSHMAYPTFRTTARFDSGMSGGPVLQNGRVKGLVCASGCGPDEDPNTTSYASILAPAMALIIEMPIAEGVWAERFLWDALEGTSAVQDRDRKAVHRQGNAIGVRVGDAIFRNTISLGSMMGLYSWYCNFSQNVSRGSPDSEPR